MKAGPASIRHTTYTVRRGSQALPSQGQMADKGESDVCLIRRVALSLSWAAAWAMGPAIPPEQVVAYGG